MEYLPIRSEYIGFLDECGDHGLVTIDRDFPLFLLSLVVVRRSCYVDRIVPEVTNLKLRFWDHEGVNLHSRDIRKAQGPFHILHDPRVKQAFQTRLSHLMRVLPFSLFVAGIRKDRLRVEYRSPENPYTLALTFILERVIAWMEQGSVHELPLMAESRGRNEDNELKAAFHTLVHEGTSSVTQARFRKRAFPVQFHDKRKNIAGIQLADLCAYPSARHMLDKGSQNRAFEIVKHHLYMNDGQTVGWKEFPAVG
ncbi:MAG: DUF3800 domain-containing protein [Planctomycetes bacterium]|nr:DUF3800 domain-containing protein [Planctomycetota bacterium]